MHPFQAPIVHTLREKLIIGFMDRRTCEDHQKQNHQPNRMNIQLFSLFSLTLTKFEPAKS